MKFMTMVKTVKGAGEPPMALMEAIMAFGQEAAAAGVLVEQGGLLGKDNSAFVSIRRGAITVIDGPFAETKEQLLGFYVVTCDNADAALDVARDLRRVNPGAVYEIRPIRLYIPGEALPESG
jgi:hypothetical protein